MKILSKNLTSPTINRGELKSNNKQIKDPMQKQDYDKITIGATSVTDLPSNQFVNVLKNQLLSEVKSGASAYKLNGLKNQVTLGEYDINSVDIVRKMMLDVEG